MINRTRRDFLKAVGALSAGSMLGGFGRVARAVAAAGGDPAARFVLIRVHGAMDSTLGLHPWLRPLSGIDPLDLFVANAYDPAKDARTFGPGGLSLGPAALGLAPFADQMAVIRGVFVGPNDLGHPFALQHMSAGRTQESAPHWSAYIAREAAGYDGALFAITNSSLQRGAIAPFPTLVTSVLQTQALAAAREAETPTSMLSLYQERDLGVRRYLNFLSDREKLTRFMDAFRASPGFDAGGVSDLDLTAASLYAGIGRVAQIDLVEGRDGFQSIDTHAQHARLHADQQRARWTLIARFLSRLREMDLLSSTLVCVITEFNRTPGLNANGGKDHNYPDNAVALFGRGVRGGTAVGDRVLRKRSEGFQYAYWSGAHVDFGVNEAPGGGRVVDLRPGQRTPRGVDLIRPQDVWRTIATSIEPDLAAEGPSEARLIPGLFA